MKEKDEEEGGFLPVSSNDNSDSGLQIVTVGDAGMSSSLWCSSFPISSAVRGLVKQGLPWLHPLLVTKV